MLKTIIVIIVGLISAVVLSLTSYDSNSGVIRALFWTALLATAGVILYSGIETIRSERDLRLLQTKVTAVHDYSEVARLNTQGKPFPDGDIAFNSPLSQMMDGTYYLEGNTFFFHRTPEAEAQLRKVVQKYPEFPFAHYALALCMRDRGDSEWRTEAIRARDIFRITTSLPGHQPDHDDALARLDQLLQP